MKKYMKYLITTCFLLIAFLALPIKSEAANTTSSRQYTQVEDYAGYLTEAEISKLRDKLDKISENRQMDISIVTVNSLSDWEDTTDKPYTQATPLADDWFDYNGYGYGPDKDGILLLVAKEDRKWAMSTSGKGIDKYTDSVLSDIEDGFKPDLSAGNYYDAFNSFADECDAVFRFPLGKYVLYSLLAGIIIAFLIVSAMKSKLKSVAFQSGAADYKEKDSLRVTNSNDFYLYSTVTRTAKPKESSSTHTSSSGSSHGGSSGSF